MTSAWLVEHPVDGPHPQLLLPLAIGVQGIPCIRYVLYINLPENTRQHMETYPVARRVLFVDFFTKVRHFILNLCSGAPESTAGCVQVLLWLSPVQVSNGYNRVSSCLMSDIGCYVSETRCLQICRVSNVARRLRNLLLYCLSRLPKRLT